MRTAEQIIQMIIENISNVLILENINKLLSNIKNLDSQKEIIFRINNKKHCSAISQINLTQEKVMARLINLCFRYNENNKTSEEKNSHLLLDACLSELTSLLNDFRKNDNMGIINLLNYSSQKVKDFNYYHDKSNKNYSTRHPKIDTTLQENSNDEKKENSSLSGCGFNSNHSQNIKEEFINFDSNLNNKQNEIIIKSCDEIKEEKKPKNILNDYDFIKVNHSFKLEAENKVVRQTSTICTTSKPVEHTLEDSNSSIDEENPQPKSFKRGLLIHEAGTGAVGIGATLCFFGPHGMAAGVPLIMTGLLLIAEGSSQMKGESLLINISNKIFDKIHTLFADPSAKSGTKNSLVLN